MFKKMAKKALESLGLKQVAIDLWDRGHVWREDCAQLYKYYIRRRSPPQVTNLKRVFFCVSSFCNAKCVFCNYRRLEDRKQNMDTELFKKILDQFVEQGGDEIFLTPIVGEPLLDPGLFEKISYARQRGVDKVRLYTNGTLFNKKDNCRRLVDSGVTDVGISVAEFDQQIYCELYGVKPVVYHDLIDGVRQFLIYNKESGKPVRVIVSLRPKTKPPACFQSPDFVENIRPHLADNEFNYLGKFSHFNEQETVEQLKKHGLSPNDSRHVKIYPCQRCFDSVAILPDGAVRLCACRILDTQYDGLVVGDASCQPLLHIYNNEKSRHLKTEFHRYMPGVCKGCTRYKPFMKEEYEAFETEKYR